MIQNITNRVKFLISFCKRNIVFNEGYFLILSIAPCMHFDITLQCCYFNMDFLKSSFKGTATICKMEATAPDFQGGEQNHGMYMASRI